MNPVAANSVEHPVVMFCTTAARVSLLQAGEPQRLVSQALMGAMMDVSFFAVAIGRSDPKLKQLAASGLAATPARALVHCVVRLDVEMALADCAPMAWNTTKWY